MKNSKNRKLYIIVLIVLFISILIVLGYSFIRQAIDGLYQEKLNYLMEISVKSSQNIKKQINGDLSTINAISTYISDDEKFDVSNALSILKKEMNKESFKRMGIIMPDGTAYSTDNIILNFSDREYFIKAMNGISNVSDRLIDRYDGKEINVYASPIYQDANIIGVIFATKSQEQFSEAIKIESFHGEGYSYVINSDGRPVVNTDNINSIGDFENLFDVMKKYGIYGEKFDKILKDISDGKDGDFEYVRGGIRRQLCYTKIGVNDWYIVSVVPVSVISLQSNRLVKSLIILTSLIVFVIAAVSFIMNNTLQKNNKKLEKLAFYDSVTGYSNLQKFNIDAKNIILQNPDSCFVMIMIDINKFKVINDIYGYVEGNNVLKSIAEAINANLTKNETFCRVSSDNFNILMKYESNEEIIKRLEKIINNVNCYFDTYKIEIIAGIYTVIDASLDINVLSDRANISRSIAKKRNDGCWYHFFKEENRLNILKEKEIENAMEKALYNGEFEVYLQPKYSLINEKIIGAEALVRWNRPGVGLIQPIEFIPIFERNGFIRKLDLYMFESVCELLANWNRNSSNILAVPISVNVSRTNLSSNDLAQNLKKISQKYNINPKFLEIELTESAVFADVDNMIDIMTKIKNEGFLVSIDDFGSGYSSLSVIKNLPTDFVKIDKSFIDEVEKDERGEKIIFSIVSMIKLLGISSVAEGVETENQINLLKNAGCDIVQGFYYSKPITVLEFEKLIKK